MAVVVFVKDKKHDPNYKVHKFAQAVWVDKKGNTKFDLECIIDLEGVDESNKLHKITFFTSGIIKNGAKNKTDLLKDEDFCTYLYNGNYCKVDHDHVEMIVEPMVSKTAKLPEIREIEIKTNPLGFSKVSVFFSRGLFLEKEHDQKIQFAVFRIGYEIPNFCRKIRKNIFMESTWTIDIRYQDHKIFGDAEIQGDILYPKLAYFWIVLPEGRFVTEFAPQKNCFVRLLEMEPWKKVCTTLKGNSICYGWKFERNKSKKQINDKQRIHMEYRLPGLDPTISFLAFILGAILFIADFFKESGVFRLIIKYIKILFHLIF